jgi:hypothetical protein
MGVDDEVVAFAVTVGLGDGESECGGFEGEGEFGEFSAALGGEFALECGWRYGVPSSELFRKRLGRDRDWARRGRGPTRASRL